MKNTIGIIFFLFLSSCNIFKLGSFYSVKQIHKHEYWGPTIRFYDDSTYIVSKSYSRQDTGRWVLDNRRLILHPIMPKIKLQHYPTVVEDSLTGCKLNFRIDMRILKTNIIEMYVNDVFRQRLYDSIVSISQLRLQDSVYIKVIPYPNQFLFPYNPTTTYSEVLVFTNSNPYYDVGISINSINKADDYNPAGKIDTLKIHHRYIKSQTGDKIKYLKRHK